MFGCELYDEITMLKYVSENIDDAQRKQIDAHLSECDTCLQEVVAMNKIEGLTESDDILTMPQKVFSLKLFVKKHIIDRFINLGMPAELVPALATRDSSANNTKNLKITLNNPPADILIIPVDDNKFWLSIQSKALIGQYIELHNQDNAPVYMKQVEDELTTIKGITIGKYKLHIGDIVISLGIDGH
jgi:hypothetical protein